MNTYDDYCADFVIIGATWPIGEYEAWSGREKIATGTAQAMRMIADGARVREASVYDAESKCFIDFSLS